MIYFLIPVFNESENIPLLAANLQESLPEEKKHYVFVDDCSTDSTSETIRQYLPSNQLSVLKNEKNSGPGYSFNSGLEFILTQSAEDSDLVVTMEGDNTSDIKILPLMVSLIRDWNFDLSLASVYAQGGGFQRTSTFRKLISLIANQFLRSFYDIKVLTLSSFYRVYKASLIRNIKQERMVLIRESGFICALEILVKAIRSGARIIEVPMVLNSEKRKGKSKMKIMKTSWAYIRFLLASSRA